ncbi:hypothetical protein COCSADRAFT_173617 [Bipolaris sorokiniana ND90Pr]|nr:uncharacterized protein COCSADRAFT_173617 [Bipolaris sorokiniana ND90Pr]EMD62235.1 hypothetical protein COCSADRAFT_173617 [Bipolaris sorokiniana ND90Pr]
MLPKSNRAQPTPPPKKHICQVPKPLRVGFLLESFDNPDLPLIILRPPTPMWEMYNVEERLFERSGDKFMLKRSKMRANLRQEGKKMLPVPVPKLEDLLMCGGENGNEEVEADSEGLGAEWEVDYRAYMAGMDLVG